MDIQHSNLTWTSFSSSTIDISDVTDVDLSQSFQFWFLLVFNIPSIICYLVVLTYILSQKTQRQAIHNHSILVILFISFSIVLLDYTWAIESIHRGEVWIQTAAFCEVWWLLDYGFYDAGTVILAWASFERHILIFHSNLIATKRRVILIHYLPLIFISLYLSIFYVYVIFFPPCKNEYDFILPVCGANPCYISVPLLGIWDLIVNDTIATFLIAILNVSLLIRVLWQKRHHHHQNWKRCRKMAFQLLSISALYLSLNLPLSIVTLIQLTGYPDCGVQMQRYLYFFCSLIQELLPFICLTYLPGVWKKIKTFFLFDNRRIIPTLTTRAPQG